MSDYPITRCLPDSFPMPSGEGLPDYPMCSLRSIGNWEITWSPAQACLLGNPETSWTLRSAADPSMFLVIVGTCSRRSTRAKAVNRWRS